MYFLHIKKALISFLLPQISNYLFINFAIEHELSSVLFIAYTEIKPQNYKMKTLKYQIQCDSQHSDDERGEEKVLYFIQSKEENHKTIVYYAQQ